MSTPPPPAAPLDVGPLARRAATHLAARTVFMRAVTVLGTIVLARILSPADFGVYAILVLVQNVLMFVADFGVAAALIQQPHEPTREEQATAWVTQQAMWVWIVPLVWLGAPLAREAFPALGDAFVWQLRIVSIGLVFALLRSLPSAMLVRVLRYREVATIEALAHVVFYSIAIGLALAGAGSTSFAIALTIQVATAAVLVNLVWRHWAGIGWDRVIAARLLRFGVAFQGSNLANTLRDGVVPLFGGLAGGVAAIGLLQFSLRISQLAASLDDVIARVAFPAFSRLRTDPARTGRVLTDVVLCVCMAVGALQCWIVATAPSFVEVVFGPTWVPAVPALRLMCAAILLSVPARVIASAVFGQGRSRAGLIVSLTSVGVLFVAFPPLAMTYGAAGGGLAYLIAGIASFALQTRAVRASVPFSWAPAARVYLLAACAAVAAGVVAASLGGIAGLALSGLTFGLAYGALLGGFARSEVRRVLRLVGGSGSPLDSLAKGRFGPLRPPREPLL